MSLPRDNAGGIRLPTVEELLVNRATSDWLKDALQTALPRDPVDAVNDAELLAAVLDERLRNLLKTPDTGTH